MWTGIRYGSVSFIRLLGINCHYDEVLNLDYVNLDYVNLQSAHTDSIKNQW